MRSSLMGISLVLLLSGLAVSAAAQPADKSRADAPGKTAGSTVQTRADAYALTLGERRFDPLEGIPAAPAGLATFRATGPDLHLVQFNGPTRSAWLDELRASGVEIVQYIPPYTYVVWGDSSRLGRARAGRNVRWTGAFQPAYRLLPKMRLRTYGATVPVRVLIVRAANADAVVQDIESLGVRITAREVLNERFELVGGDADGALLSALANIPGVYSVQGVPTDGGLRGEMSDQVCVNNIDGGNLAFPGYLDWLSAVGLSGAGVIMANVDSGIQDSHPDLVNRMLPCIGETCGGTDQSAHGTHTAGIMAADGSSGVLDGYGFYRALGMAPAAQLVEQKYYPYFQQTKGMLLLMSDSYNNGASLSSNSWGPAGTPQGYDNDTMQVDEGVRNADQDTPGNEPLTYVLSIMNGYGGTSSQGTPDEAKNIFTIGSTRMQNGGGSQITAINDLSSNSAHGPALDGRKIPHMVAPGCYVDSSITGSSHGLMCGTSMASPHVSGTIALFIEYYRGLPDYVQDPSPALIKAAFLPVARDLAGQLDADGGVLGHRFDSKQGWGRMDAEAVLASPIPVRYFDQAVVFDDTGQEWTQTFTAGDPREPLKIMLVWTDAPGHGLGGSTPAWNNDLDLVVEEGANTFRGNYFGPTGWSVSGGSADYMNNTEGVLIGPDAPGEYTVRVIASNINSDGIPDVGSATDQDFALVCYNCAPDSHFTLAATPETVDACIPGSVESDIDIGQVLGFSTSVTLSVEGLPVGVSADFDVNPAIPPTMSILTLTATAATAGEYVVQVVGESGDLVRVAEITLRLHDDVPGLATLVTPSAGEENAALRPEFGWTAAAGGVTYELEVARDAGFENVVISASDLTELTFTPAGNLAAQTEYFWHVRAANPCGPGAYGSAFSFTTRVVPGVLLVDDDDNDPDVRSYYTDALVALGRDYEVWDTNNSDDEPSFVDLEPYSSVIWFTGNGSGSAAGPGTDGQAALADFLDVGRNLFISSQDYYMTRGMTALMSEHLGVASAASDVLQTAVSGTGSVFGGLGPFALIYPFPNRSDQLEADLSGEVAFVGDAGNAAVNKGTEVYRTVFWGFPFEALGSPGERASTLGIALDWFRPFVDCNTNGVTDHVDIFTGTSLDENENGIPDECDAPPACPGDCNCDNAIDFLDITYFVAALSGEQSWIDYHVAQRGTPPTCDWSNCNADGVGGVDFLDIQPFVALLGTPCP